MSSSPSGAVNLPIDDGPPGWRLWRAEIAGIPGVEGWESLIYTDALPVGELSDGLGPFQLFSTLADPMRDTFAPRLVLRVHWRDPGQAPERSKAKIKKEGGRWLALNVEEEIACLLSLILGFRFRSGGKVRTFSAEDPAGRPIYTEHTAPIPLAPAWRVPMMPGLAGVRIQVPAIRRFLLLYPQLEAQEAVVLVRAARHYSTALWVADNDPEQAWLQLVSALETVATQWKATNTDPAELFAEHFPIPAKLLRESGGHELLVAVAGYFTKLIGAGRRFEDFIERFKPEPPDERPPTATNAETRVDWNKLRPALKKIYGHRSALLHNGTPFPAALCVPPILIDDVPEEKPLGNESRAGNMAWAADETPLHLHIFAYLARGALLKWWTECAPVASQSCLE